MPIHFGVARAVVAAVMTIILIVFTPVALHAATAVMIWPIDPVIDSEQRATALWLENRDTKPVTLQTRVVGWHQQDHVDVYDAGQTAIAISPPMVTVQPGARQLIRLIRLKVPVARTEEAYRVLIDEIPQPERVGAPEAPDVAMGVKFQMHYSLPLFVYGEGIKAKTANVERMGGPSRAALSWTTQTVAGERWLVLTNLGLTHAKITRLAYLAGGTRTEIDLLGYILTKASMRWKMPDRLRSSTDFRILATIDDDANVVIPPSIGP